MANVNPTPMKVPQAVRALSPDLFNYLDELSFMIYQLRERTGGGGDTINEISNTESYETNTSTGELQQLIEGIESEQRKIETKIFTAVEVSQDYTAANLDYVETTGNVTIRLDDVANSNDEIIIANGDGGKVTVDAQSSTINYTTNEQKLIIRRKGTSLHFQRFENHWRIR